MGIFMPDDPHYDETKRQTGFRRYTQLLEGHWSDWIKLNAVTVLGALPLAFGISLGISSSSILVLFPCSMLGGMIFGPFLAGLYDALLRAFRDDSMPMWSSYRKSWRQNWKGSLIPGMLLGFMLGLFSFMGMLFWWAASAPSPTSVLLMLFSGMLTAVIFQLYFSQLVLFEMSPWAMLRNALLFTLQNFWRVCGAALLQIGCWLIYLLFAPWSLLLLPILGIWYILFVSELMLYERLNDALDIEAQFKTT